MNTFILLSLVGIVSCINVRIHSNVWLDNEANVYKLYDGNGRIITIDTDFKNFKINDGTWHRVPKKLLEWVQDELNTDQYPYEDSQSFFEQTFVADKEHTLTVKNFENATDVAPYSDQLGVTEVIDDLDISPTTLSPFEILLGNSGKRQTDNRVHLSRDKNTTIHQVYDN